MPKTRKTPPRSGVAKSKAARQPNATNIQKFDPLFHEIQNQLHIIKMEFDLLRMPDIKAFNSQRAVTALRRLTDLLRDLEGMVEALDAFRQSV
jgi:hypothetical protein